MKASRFSDAQKAFIIKQGEDDTIVELAEIAPMPALLRRIGFGMYKGLPV